MLARRLEAPALAGWDPDALVGAVLLGPVSVPGTTLRKGMRLDRATATTLIAASRRGELTQPVRAGWLEPGDLHEDEAAERLATVAAGQGLVCQPPRQSRLDLTARWAGVLHVQLNPLLRLNTVDSLELFTLFHGQAVAAGQVVASVKVAPHILPATLLEQGLRIAAEDAPLVDVRPYQRHQVGALAVEALSGTALERFEAGVRKKVDALGSTFAGITVLPGLAAAEARRALQTLALDRSISILLVGGVSAGDPLSPFYTALEELGGRVLRHGVPAHPGSMIWLAELGSTRLLGLPRCGMFAMATAADLILPRLLTGERLTAGSLAELAHGGVLGPEMRFRFPPYARDLDVPE
ncbi:MAG TPA: hypothetical protein VF252_04815 [Gemmatimonadales bacterium]